MKPCHNGIILAIAIGGEFSFFWDSGQINKQQIEGEAQSMA